MAITPGRDNLFTEIESLRKRLDRIEARGYVTQQQYKPSSGASYDDPETPIRGRIKIHSDGTNSAGIWLGAVPETSIYGQTFFGSSGITGQDFCVWAGGAYRLLIDSSGRITKPYQPMVYAYNTTNRALADNAVISFDNAQVNVGSHWNTSTSVFTAPVTGKYLVLVKVLSYADTGGTDFRIALNGTRQDQWAGYSIQAGVVNGYKQGAHMGIMSVSANDTISAKTTGTVNEYGSSAGHSAITIMLVG